MRQYKTTKFKLEKLVYILFIAFGVTSTLGQSIHSSGFLKKITPKDLAEDPRHLTNRSISTYLRLCVYLNPAEYRSELTKIFHEIKTPKNGLEFLREIGRLIRNRHYHITTREIKYT